MNAPLESQEQKWFVEWFKKSYPGVVIMMIRNDGSRSPREKIEQIAMGLHKGAADLYIPAWKLWIEIKRTKGWKLSEDQEKFRDYVVSIGHHWIMPRGFEEAKQLILLFLSDKSLV